MLRHQARLSEAVEFAGRWLETARHHGWPAQEASFLGDLGDVLHRTRDLGQAMSLSQRAVEMHRRQGNEGEAARCLRVQANVHRLRGNHDEARAALLALLPVYEALDDPLHGANAMRDLAIVEIADGNPERGAELVAQARRHYEAAGFRMGVVRCINTQGTVLMAQGRLDEAIEALTEGLKLDGQVLTGLGSMFAINLAICELRSGRFVGAEEVVVPFLEEVFQAGEPTFELVYRLVRLCAALGQRPVPDWEAQLDAIVALIGRTAMCDADLAWPFEIAGRQAGLRGQPDAERALLDLALAQWAGLGRADGVARIRGG